MTFYMLVTNDEFELPLVIEKQAADLVKYAKGKTKDAIYCNITRDHDTLSTIFGPAKIRKVRLTISKSDLQFALAYDISYLSDNFSTREIATALNVPHRTYCRHTNDPEWIRTKIEAALNF